MIGLNLKREIDQIAKDKGIESAEIIAALEDAMKQAARRRHGQEKEIDARYNEELGEVELLIQVLGKTGRCRGDRGGRQQQGWIRRLSTSATQRATHSVPCMASITLLRRASPVLLCRHIMSCRRMIAGRLRSMSGASRLVSRS